MARNSVIPGKRTAIVMTSATSFNHLMRGQLEYLHSLGLKLDLYSGGPEEELEALRKRRVGRVCHVPMRREPSLFWDLACLGWLALLFLVRRYDAVVYSTPKAMFLGSVAAFLTRQRHRIAWVRGRAYENFSGRKRRAYVGLDKLTFRLSDRVVLVSPSLMEAYRGDGIDVGGKGYIVGYGSSNGVDTDRFIPLDDARRNAIRAELGFSPGDFVIVVVGRIRADKGAREVIELSRRLADLPQIRIAIVGDVEEPALEEELKSDHDRLRWFRPTSEVERFFQVADLQLFLSHREGFGNVAIEAAAAGIPTFGYDVVGIRDSVVDGDTGRLFPFRDLDSLEAAIRAAAADPAALRTRFSRARQVVTERFSQRRVWEAYARVFAGEAPEQGAERRGPEAV